MKDGLIWVNQIKGGEIHEETIGGIDIKRGYGSGYAVRMRGICSGSGGQKDAAEAAAAGTAASTAAAGSGGGGGYERETQRQQNAP